MKPLQPKFHLHFGLAAGSFEVAPLRFPWLSIILQFRFYIESLHYFQETNAANLFRLCLISIKIQLMVIMLLGVVRINLATLSCIWRHGLAAGSREVAQSRSDSKVSGRL